MQLNPSRNTDSPLPHCWRCGGLGWVRIEHFVSVTPIVELQRCSCRVFQQNTQIGGQQNGSTTGSD